MKRLANYFMQGLVLVAPVGITIFVCYQVFRWVDGLLTLTIPGLGFLITVAIVTLVGFLGSTFLTRRLVGFVERLMNRVPLVRLVYSSIKDLLNAFVGEKRRFDKPVLVLLARDSDARVLGFVTQESLERLGRPDFVSVYVPQSYNLAGSLLVVPGTHIERLHAESSGVMAFIVSGGVTEVPLSAR